jgi:hypothetical protein
MDAIDALGQPLSVDDMVLYPTSRGLWAGQIISVSADKLTGVRVARHRRSAVNFIPSDLVKIDNDQRKRRWEYKQRRALHACRVQNAQ